MRIIPISEIGAMDDKELIRAVQGTITKIYKAKRGVGSNNKPYSFQDLYLKDRTGEIKVCVNGREESDDVPMNWRGKEIIIEAQEGNRGYTGVYAHDDDYKDPVVRCIRVTPTGEIYLANGAASPPASQPDAPAPRQAAQQRKAAAPPPAKPAGAPQEAPPPAAEETPEDRAVKQERAVKDAKIFLAQNANLYNLAVEVVVKVIKPHFEKVTGAQMDAEQFQATVSTMYISAQRGAHLDIGMPVKPLASPPAPTQTAPPPPAAPPPKPPPQKPTPDDDYEVPF